MAWAILLHPEVRSEFSLSVFRIQLLGRTLGYNALAAIIATAMGLPAGIVLGRGRGLFSKVLWVLLPAALLLPSLSYAYGWAQLVRMMRNSDLFRPVLHSLGITFRPNGPADVFRCIWSLAAWLWAVPAGLIGIALSRLDPSVQQAAALDGALVRVTLRQLAGPIIASAAIVTILASQEFAVYEPTGISVTATEVRMVFDTGATSSADNSIAGPVASGEGLHASNQAQRAAAAVATAAPMEMVTIVLAIVAAWGASQTAASDEINVGDWPRVLDASKFAVITTLVLLLLNIGVPIVALLGALRIALSVPKMFNEFGPQVIGSVQLASFATVVATLASLSAGARWTRGLLAIAGASFLIGGQLLAIALIRVFNRPGFDWVYDTAVVSVIAYVGRFGWLAIAAGRTTWSRPWNELRDVAAVDGANAIRTAASVIWPLAWPALVAGGVIVGALSLTEVPATVLLMPQHPQVLTPMLMTWVHQARSDPMIEASLLMMLLVVLPAVLGVLLLAAGVRVLRRSSDRG